MNEEDKYMVNCTRCQKLWDKRDLERSCSNCFACTGCEAYICPDCRYEIVVIPMRKMKRG